jgi:hypothetical protein
VVGDQEAVIYKRLRRSGFAPRNARATVVFWASMFWHVSHMSFRRTYDWRERARVLGLSWAYVYRLGIRRPHLLRTAWRVLRMVTVAAVSGLVLAGVHVARTLTRRLFPSRAV